MKLEMKNMSQNLQIELKNLSKYFLEIPEINGSKTLVVVVIFSKKSRKHALENFN